MPVYRVESGKVRHRGETYRPGDEFEADLSDRQVDAMEITAVDDDAETDGGTASDDAAESGATDDEVADAVDEAEDDPEELTAAFVEDADYADLRSAAGEFDDVNGNWGEDRLRTELLDRVEG